MIARISLKTAAIAFLHTVLVAGGLLFSPASKGQDADTLSPSVVGQWSAPANFGVVAIHTHLLPNGNVLFWSRDDSTLTMMTHVWNPSTGVFTNILNSNTNLFCSGHSFLPDGRLLVTGGHHFFDGHGEPHTNIFDYVTNTWTRVGDMNLGRWYPTNCTLGNGEVLVVSGSYFNGTISVNNTLPQVWSTTVGWRSLTTASLQLPLYPFMLLAHDGTVFNAGPDQVTRFLNTSGTGSWRAGPTSAFGFRDTGSAVMYDDSKVMLIGGGSPTKTVEVVNLARDNPAWRPVADMASPRRQLNATILADGKILVTGGTSSAGFNNAVGSVLAAEIWDPKTEMWTTGASMQVRRLYHSTAILLPDGRVLSAGGGHPAGSGLNPPDTNHPDMEIYSPPYLFKGPRPTTVQCPSTVTHGQTFFVGTPDYKDIVDVIFVRLSSVTHAFNENQRINYLSFTPVVRSVDEIGFEEPVADGSAGIAIASTGLNVTAPGSSNLCPPGHYMMFLINRAGAPSIARFVRVGSNKPLNAIDDSRFFVRQHYYDLLNREPDSPGWQGHVRTITACVNDLTCRDQQRVVVSRRFWDSPEFRQLFPSVVNPSGNPMYVNSEFVRLCYVLYLRRNPDPVGFNGWLNSLNQDNDYNRVIRGFITSPEYRARFIQP